MIYKLVLTAILALGSQVSWAKHVPAGKRHQKDKQVLVTEIVATIARELAQFDASVKIFDAQWKTVAQKVMDDMRVPEHNRAAAMGYLASEYQRVKKAWDAGVQRRDRQAREIRAILMTLSWDQLIVVKRFADTLAKAIVPVRKAFAELMKHPDMRHYEVFETAAHRFEEQLASLRYSTDETINRLFNVVFG